MSLDNLGNKQTIILHNTEINNEKYDLVITPNRQSTGYIRTKRQTVKGRILSKQRQITEKDFQNKETHSPNQKQVVYKNFLDKKTQK